MPRNQGQRPVLEDGANDLGLELIDFIVSLNSHEELCQRLVNDPSFRGRFLGARFFRVGSDLCLTAETCYGRVIEIQENHSLRGIVGEALEAKSPKSHIGSDENWLIVPLLRGSLPLAVLVLSVDKSLDVDQKILRTASIAAKIGFYFYCFVPQRSISHTAATGLPSNFQLSDRHRSILEFISAGFSNKDISKKLLISESTVRQENIKIFKYLGVRSRKEAVEQARLISEGKI